MKIDYGNVTPTTLADVRAWREGWWYLVEAHGRIVYRRHTRDDSFTHVRLLFPGSGSTPELEKRKWGQCYDIEPVGEWSKKGRYVSRWGSYDLTVPIWSSRELAHQPSSKEPF